MKDIDITIKRLERLADDYQSIADQIGHKLGDSDALLLLKGVVIGMRRCVNELRPVQVVDPDDTRVDTSMGNLRSAIKQARGGDAPMNIWYVLYGGISDDGRGEGKFAGRTEDKNVAREWFKRVKKDPYSVGGVRIIDDVSDRMAFRLEDFK